MDKNKPANTTKRKRGGFFILLLVFLLLFGAVNYSLAKKCNNDSDCGGTTTTVRCIDHRCVRTLEITYPQIGKGPVPQTTAFGLPDYINYIFKFAVAVIGIIIFGVLTYNGFLYITSAGRPEQMSRAKTGIFSAFLGGLLLISSVLIFRTINPQLTVMNLPETASLEQIIQPGIYVCNYTVSKDLNNIINDYVQEQDSPELDEAQKEVQRKAADQLRHILWDPDSKHGCPRVNFSGDLKNYSVENDYTIFAIPSIEITKQGRKAVYEYGIILHEKEKFSGKSYLVNAEGGTSGAIYEQIHDFAAKGMPFEAKSVTLFQKPALEPQGQGATLYECFNYNREGACKDHNPPLSQKFKPQGDADFQKFDQGELKAPGGKSLVSNSRSISFAPEGSYFAILFEKAGFGGASKVVPENMSDLADLPLGCCNQKVIEVKTFWWDKKICYPCLNSMIIVKGHIL